MPIFPSIAAQALPDDRNMLAAEPLYVTMGITWVFGGGHMVESGIRSLIESAAVEELVVLAATVAGIPAPPARWVSSTRSSKAIRRFCWVSKSWSWSTYAGILAT